MDVRSKTLETFYQSATRGTLLRGAGGTHRLNESIRTAIGGGPLEEALEGRTLD